MAKLTEYGRMRRRIKKELDAARMVKALAHAQMAAILSAGAAQISVIASTVIDAKMLAAWKKEKAGAYDKHHAKGGTP